VGSAIKISINSSFFNHSKNDSKKDGTKARNPGMIFRGDPKFPGESLPRFRQKSLIFRG